MSPRRKRLIAYAAGASLLLAALVAVVYVRERRPPPDTTGIDDVLYRDLPADAPRVAFGDATPASGIRFRHSTGARSRLLPEDMGSGLAWGDCNGDGAPDLYAVDFAGRLSDPAAAAQSQGNALFRNRADGTFEDISEESGARLRGFGMGAAWGDYDGDGDLDLYVTQYGGNVLLRNDGACRFDDVTGAAAVGGGGFSAGATWGDYDGDDDLDLYVTRYVDFDEQDASGAAAGRSSQQFDRTVPYALNPAAFEPLPNLLFRNRGDGSFEEVAAAAGVANPAGRSLAAVWADFDLDGDADLYVANDVSDNAFYLNRGDGTFEDISASSLTADYRGAMGLAVTDFDRDGDLDFFVTHWIAQENGLYRNHLEVQSRGGVFFADVAEMMGLGYTALQYVGWGTDFIDYDNDGWKDLVIVNGHTLEDAADSSRLLPQRMQLFWSRGEQGFYDLTAVAGTPLDRLLVGRGAAAADYDGDGDVDVAVSENGGPLLLLANGGSPANHWLELDLRQEGGNRFALGAVVTVQAGGAQQTQAVGASPSYLSQSVLTLHFGLGPATAVDAVTVRWPGGATERFTPPEVDARHTLTRGAGTAE